MGDAKLDGGGPHGGYAWIQLPDARLRPADSTRIPWSQRGESRWLTGSTNSLPSKTGCSVFLQILSSFNPFSVEIPGVSGEAMENLTKTCRLVLPLDGSSGMPCTGVPRGLAERRIYGGWVAVAGRKIGDLSF